MEYPPAIPPVENGSLDPLNNPQDPNASTDNTTEAPPNPALTKYHELWREVQAMPTDFNAWTNLINAVEKLDDLEKVQTVYDTFLASYPLCYGYWKKYADAELRLGSAARAAAVYERAVSATPYSVDIWMHYSAFHKELPEATSDSMRGVFERAVAAVGTDYLSHNIWNKYLAYEEEQGNKLFLVALYTRLLGMPIRDLDKYYQGLKTLVSNASLLEVMTEEEASLIRSQLEEEQRQAAVEAAAAAAAAAKAKSEEEAAAAEAAQKAAESSAVDAPAEAKPADAVMTDADAVSAMDVAPGENPSSVPAEPVATDVPADSSAVAESSVPVESIPTAMVTEEDVKAGWMRSRDALYGMTAAELENRRLFEELIKRSYFHVKPLDATQLTNWLKYLDYMEGKGDNVATMVLYERCLVPCASYPEYWERYIRWLEKHGLNEEAHAALQRATITFCRSRPEIHLFAMHFDERHGDMEGARKRYKHVLEELAPRLLSATIAAANFEKRHGNKEAACQLFELLMKEEQAKDDGASKSTLPFLAMQYAQFLRVAFKDYAKGRQVLHDALAVSPNKKQLWEAAICYEEAVAADDMVKVVLELCERASAPQGVTAQEGKPVANLPDKDREDFSLKAIEFADAHGSMADLLEAERRHAANFLVPSNVATEGRKRHAEAAAADALTRPAKAAHADTAAAAAAAAATNAAAASYYGHAAAPGAAAAAAAYQGYYGAYPSYPAAAYPGQYPGYGYGY